MVLSKRRDKTSKTLKSASKTRSQPKNTSKSKRSSKQKTVKTQGTPRKPKQELESNGNRVRHTFPRKKTRKSVYPGTHVVVTLGSKQEKLRTLKNQHKLLKKMRSVSIHKKRAFLIKQGLLKRNTKAPDRVVDTIVTAITTFTPQHI